jgi:hypothetical protein
VVAVCYDLSLQYPYTAFTTFSLSAAWKFNPIFMQDIEQPRAFPYGEDLGQW